MKMVVLVVLLASSLFGGRKCLVPIHRMCGEGGSHCHISNKGGRAQLSCRYGGRHRMRIRSPWDKRRWFKQRVKRRVDLFSSMLCSS
jgi:hypothetical protein